MTVAHFSRRLRGAVAEGRRLLVVDSVNGFLNAVPSESYLASRIHALLDFLARQGVVTILVLGQHGFLGNLQTPLEVSYLADNNVHFRFFEAAGRVRKAISMAKRRAGPHEQTIRELSIERDGIRVGPPLSELTGVLSGAPTYLGRTEEGGFLVTGEGEPSGQPAH